MPTQSGTAPPSRPREGMFLRRSMSEAPTRSRRAALQATPRLTRRLGSSTPSGSARQTRPILLMWRAKRASAPTSVFGQPEPSISWAREQTKPAALTPTHCIPADSARDSSGLKGQASTPIPPSASEKAAPAARTCAVFGSATM